MESTKLGSQSESAGASYPVGEYQDGGYVRIGPGYITLYAPLNVTTLFQTLDFTGSTIVCKFDADCINVTAPASGVTLINPRGQPTVMNGRRAFIAVYGMGTRIYNVRDHLGLQVPGQPNGTWGKFGYGVVDVVDQAMVLDGVTFAQITCNAAFCGSAVYAPGPFNGSSRWPSGTNNAAVGWLKHLNLSLGCQNGVDWQSGNTLRISDSVIQGYGQFGVRTGLAGPQGPNGGYGMTQIDNLYEEIGGCKNVLGNIGTAGVIVNTGNVIINGGEGPQGNAPQFANTGDTEYQYWVIARNATQRASNPMYVGRAKSNGSGDISVSFYSPLGMSDFTLTRATGDVNTSVPTGTGDYAVVINVQASGACDPNHVCKVIDTQEKLKSYTMPTASGKPGWFPILPMGVGGLVLGGTGSTTSGINTAEATLNINQYNRIGLFQNNVTGLDHPVVFSQECLAASPGAPLWQICGSSNTAVASNATILGGAYKTGIKGRLNFLTSNSKSHIITLVDSAPDRTLSAMGSNNRPGYDKNDAYIGCDSNYCQEAHTGIAIGAPVSISGYIANAGDGAAWKERLTATQKSFAVPIKTPGATLKLSTNEIAAHTCSAAQPVALAGLSPDSVIKWSFARTPIGVAGYGTGTLQISTFATSDTANFVVCNITSSTVTPGAIAVNVREEQ